MKTTRLLLATMLCCAGNAAYADDTAPPATERMVQVIVAPGSEISIPNLGPRLAVKNLPYVLDIVKERQQVLTDGNQITQRSGARWYRDSDGRTREETLDDAGEARLIVIKDPQAGLHWMLNPQSKTAVRMTAPMGSATHTFKAPKDGNIHLLERRFKPDGTQVVTWKSVAPPDGSGVERTVASGITMTVQENPNAGRATLPQMNPLLATAFTDMKWARKATLRDLPPRDIAGIKATGQLRSYEIPAGELGNRNPIVVSDETWYAPELRITLSSKHSDPRTGDALFRVENIKREEPAPALFLLPADYAVTEVKAMAPRPAVKKAE